jgi:hypothetical protein
MAAGYAAFATGLGAFRHFSQGRIEGGLDGLELAAVEQREHVHPVGPGQVDTRFGGQ